METLKKHYGKIILFALALLAIWYFFIKEKGVAAPGANSGTAGAGSGTAKAGDNSDTVTNDKK